MGTFSFDPDEFWRMHEQAHERKIEKLKTFEPGDRVTKQWLSIEGPQKDSVINGIFIEAVDETHCKVKWEDEDEIEDDCPVSKINHA